MIVTFLLSGMWHGAGWTFLLWGLYQGIFIVISMNLSKSRKRFEKKHHLKNNRLYEFFTMFVTFFIVCIGLILFRAESIGMAWEYVCGMCNRSIFTVPWLINREYYIPTFVSVLLLLLTEWVSRAKQHGLSVENCSVVFRWIFYSVIVILIVYEGGQPAPFVYFQF